MMFQSWGPASLIFILLLVVTITQMNQYGQSPACAIHILLPHSREQFGINYLKGCGLRRRRRPPAFSEVNGELAAIFRVNSAFEITAEHQHIDELACRL